ncbi:MULTISPECIES: hypothetical protein [Mameliella]|uniref:hypothetical protein n=1 Tax=Mameliella TaxID=1434019 RepID=UPI000B530F31|nr:MULTISPECIES: hypothetical protein [Mameliella]MCR9274076.1 hypothetical protein [Paracoccaceae bacterium]OWV59079.1 hypothetical protein CDZ98_12260 [Mameliella alba]
MYLLAGLMGLIALGSVAIVSIGDDADEALADTGDDGDDGLPASPLSPASLGVFQFFPQGIDEGTPEGTALEDGRSLFARMGLINLAGLDPVEDAELADTGAGALQLESFGVDVPAAPDDASAELAGADPLDYDAEEDQLVIVYDDSAGGPEPELEVSAREDDPETTEIRLGGTVLASLPTAEAPPLSLIVLVGESDAAALDLAT